MSDIVKIENGKIICNKELLIKHLRKAGEKSLGGFSIDDALEYAFKAGVDVGIKAVNSKIYRNRTAILREEEENEKSMCIF